MIAIDKPEELLNTEHYQIIIFDSVNVNDGWGGTYSQPFTKIYCYDASEIQEAVRKLEKEFSNNSYSRKPYRVQKVNPVEVRTEIVVAL